MRTLPLAVIIVSLLVSNAAGARTHPATPLDSRMDAFFDAGATDSVLSITALEIPRARARGDSVTLGRMLLCRGRARLTRRLPGARGDFDAAFELAAATRDTLGESNALGFQSLVAIGDGRLDASIRMNERRLALATAWENRRGVGWAHMLIGYACLVRGNPERAHEEYRQASDAFGALHRPREELAALIGLGRALHSLGRIDEAREVYEKALHSAQSLGDASQEADAWNNLGGIASTQGELALAARDFEHAYELKKRLDASDAAAVGGNLALVHTRIGRYAAAESVLVDAVRVARSWNDHLGVGILLQQEGELRLAQGRPHAAEAVFRSVVARGDSVSALTRMGAVTGLAESLVAQHRPDAATAVLDSGLTRLSSFPPSDTRTAAYTAWSECLLASGQPGRASEAAAAAWEDATSRTDTTGAILAAVRRSECLRAGGDPAGAYVWFERAHAMFGASTRRSTEYQWREVVRTHLAPALVSCAAILLEWPARGTRADHERALFDVLQETKARTLMERLREPRKADAGDAAVEPPAGVREIQDSALRSGECLLDITVGERDIYLFAVTADSLRLVRIEDGDHARRQNAGRFVSLVGHPPSASESGADAHADAVLTDMLSGCADLIRSSPSLVVAVDGWLASIPFATLSLPGDDAPLVLLHTITTVPTASLLCAARRAHEPPHDPATVVALAPVGPDLPGARREVGRLAHRYAGVTRLDSIPSLDACAKAIGACDVLHIASHVRVDGERPWHSGIQVNREGAAFSFLRASQIAHDRFRGALVVLSGCESGLGRVTQGEGVLGLTSAFMSAGARAVVASLWSVDDRVTADFMRVFYDRLAAGDPVSAALRGAQLWTRARHPAPFYWAGFTVVGDGDLTMPLSPRHRSPILLSLLVLAGALGIGALVWLVFRKRAAPV